MQFVFRVDASSEIGAGHIVRCAALAKGLAGRQHGVRFICRTAVGDLTGWLEQQGFRVDRISVSEASSVSAQQEFDLVRTDSHPVCDWLVVDHYGLGLDWERRVRPLAKRIFVIDDLGRPHDCDLLLDQNYRSPRHAQYPGHVPAGCDLLLGSRFALLRPEFQAMRDEALARPRTDLRRLLVFMGGSDPTDATSKVLEGVRRADLDTVVDIVVGAGNPHVQSVKRAAAALDRARVHIQTDRMAQLMAEADCGIGAAGSASWERCALGLPALVTILSKDQVAIAQALHEAGAHRLLGFEDDVTADDYALGLRNLSSGKLVAMSQSSAAICDGRGVDRVAARLTAPN